METYQIGGDQDVYMLKADIRLNNSNQLVLRFNQQNFTGNNNENGGPLSVEEHSGNSVAKTTTFSGSWNREFVGGSVDESGGDGAVWWGTNVSRRTPDSVRFAVQV